MYGSQLISTVSILFFALFAATALASEKVTISSGEVVILYDDGTWNYEKRPVQRNKVIKTNRSRIQKSDNCYYPANPYFNDTNLWIEPGKWKNTGDPHVQPPNRLIEQVP